MARGPTVKRVLVSLNAVIEGIGVKVAVTDWLELSVTAQGPVPLQPPPDQPVKTEPNAGVAIRVTSVPLA